MKLRRPADRQAVAATLLPVPSCSATQISMKTPGMISISPSYNSQQHVHGEDQDQEQDHVLFLSCRRAILHPPALSALVPSLSPLLLCSVHAALLFSCNALLSLLRLLLLFDKILDQTVFSLSSLLLSFSPARPPTSTFGVFSSSSNPYIRIDCVSYRCRGIFKVLRLPFTLQRYVLLLYSYLIAVTDLFRSA